MTIDYRMICITMLLSFLRQKGRCIRMHRMACHESEQIIHDKRDLNTWLLRQSFH